MYKIGQLFKVLLNNDETVYTVLAIGVVQRNPIYVGLVVMWDYYQDDDSLGSIWSKSVEWKQADSTADIMWNHISQNQFDLIKGDMFDQFIPISFDEYKHIFNTYETVDSDNMFCDKS